MELEKPSEISVIIAAYSAEETLTKQLDALRAQDYGSEMVIIADRF